MIALFWMLTNGTGDLFQSGLNTDFYDSQARALMAGHWWMSPGVLSIEGIVEHHRTYMYYGPVPAVLRMPLLLFTHSLDGKLTGCSMLLAFAVALAFTGRILWKLRDAVAGDRAVSWVEAGLAGAFLVVAGVGSNFLFLASDTIIYHEAEAWGAALAIAAFDFVLSFLLRPRIGAVVAASVFATLSMLTRGSVGAGPVIALGIIGAVVVLATVERRLAGTLSGAVSWIARVAGFDSAPSGALLSAVLVAGLLLPVAAYAAVNEAKFGTLFSLPLNHQVETALSPHRRAVLAANGGNYFSIRYIPTALVAYLRPAGISLTRLFPFVMFPDAVPIVGHVRYDDRDWASSVTASMPLLTLLGIVGLVRLPRLLRAPVVGAIAGTAGVLTIAYIANRYLADFMPLLLLLSAAGFHVLLRWCRTWRWPVRILAAAGLALVCVGSLWTSTGLALVYQRELRPAVPLSERAGFVAFQEQLDQSLFGNPPTHVIRSANALPPPAPAGTLAIIGSCRALYQSAGIGSGWDAVERSGAGGHVAMRVVFPRGPSGRWWPVAANGVAPAGSWLALRSTAPGHYQFGYYFQGESTTFLLGPVFAATAGRSHVIDAVFDPLVHEVSASVDGAPQFELGYFVRANLPLEVGVNHLGGPVAARFPGKVTGLPVRTPICDSLERRLRSR